MILRRGKGDSSPRRFYRIQNKRNLMTHQAKRPYIVVGADRIAASVYKTGDDSIGFDYRFNLTHINQRTCRVAPWFSPADIISIVALTRTLAAELVHDGCVEPQLRKQFLALSAALDGAIAKVSPMQTGQGAKKR